MELILKDSRGSGEIIILAPYFGPYIGMIKIAGGRPVIVNTDENFLPNLKEIEKHITKNT